RRPDDAFFVRSLRVGGIAAFGGAFLTVAFGGPQFAEVTASHPLKLATGAKLAKAQADMVARYGPGDYAPPQWVHTANIAMIVLWALMLVTTGAGLALLLYGVGLDKPGARVVLRVLVWSIPLPFVAYFALGGLDIGVGLLLPVHPYQTRRAALNALGPFFLGNEVWIIGAAGALLAAFPRVESALFHAAYPLVIAIVAGLVGINAGVQLRSRPAGTGPRAAFDGLIAVSAAVLAFGWGALLGNLLTGLPL